MVEAVKRAYVYDVLPRETIPGVTPFGRRFWRNLRP